MKIIKSGCRYDFYTDDLVVKNTLAPGFYTVRCNPKTGFYLEDYPEIKTSIKLYGVIDSKAIKAVTGFTRATANFGVILSGEKGMGKSLCAKRIAELGAVVYPVLIIDCYYPGIAAFINSIEQEVICIFDEYDKTFCGDHDQHETAEDPQTEMLTLFDGFSIGKKMFVITANKIRSLSNYLVNRPGRFHYHLRFDYPTFAEITEYLTDNLETKYHDQIKDAVSFASKVKLNYDALSAIALEINTTGDTFKEAIRDLNIINFGDREYNSKIECNCGELVNERNLCLDLFDNDIRTMAFYHTSDPYTTILTISFCPIDLEFNEVSGCYDLPISKIKNIDIQPDLDWNDSQKQRFKNVKIKAVHFKETFNKTDGWSHYIL